MAWNLFQSIPLSLVAVFCGGTPEMSSWNHKPLVSSPYGPPTAWTVPSKSLVPNKKISARERAKGPARVGAKKEELKLPL